MVLCEVTLVERELDLPGACRWCYLCGRVYVVYGPTAGCCRFALPYSPHRYCLPVSRFAVIPAGRSLVIPAAPHSNVIPAQAGIQWVVSGSELGPRLRGDDVEWVGNAEF